MPEQDKEYMPDLPNLSDPRIEPTDEELRAFGRSVLRNVQRTPATPQDAKPMAPEEYARRMEKASEDARHAAKGIYGRNSGSDSADNSGA